jgi:site-specific DNA-methyltransferase (adenine-specific)
MFIANLVSIFNEARRVLKAAGTLWIVIGDTYGEAAEKDKKDPKNPRRNIMQDIPSSSFRKKCLIQIPSRLGIALYEQGWILRNEIIWHKPNAMPHSVKDRFTVDFEKVLFLSKSEKYFFNQPFECLTESSIRRKEYANNNISMNRNATVIRPISVKEMGERFVPSVGRNMRTVWTIPTKSYRGDHYAVFPEKLVERMILAGCPDDGTILDPFCGSGTTLSVARKLDRNAIGIEINPKYKEQIEKRGMLNIQNISSFESITEADR